MSRNPDTALLNVHDVFKRVEPYGLHVFTPPDDITDEVPFVCEIRKEDFHSTVLVTANPEGLFKKSDIDTLIALRNL